MTDQQMANKYTTDYRGEALIMPRVPQPARPNNANSARSQRPSPPVYSFENPPPRESYRPESAPLAEPGFYVVYQSMPIGRLFNHLFEDKSTPAIRNFSALNPDLEDIVKAGTLIVLSDPKKTSCTYAESQLMSAAREVKEALDPLTPEEADFMMKHADEIATFTGQTSTWLGVSAVVLEKHLARLRDTLVSIERLHQDSFRKHGHLRSAEFFAERKRLMSQLDAHLLNSRSLRNLTSFNDHSKLKRALGISSQSLVHHWQAAGTAGPIPGYAKHVKAMSRATKYMQGGGYIGIALGGVSSLLAVQEVCNAGSDEACRKVRYTEGGKFALSSGFGYIGGEIGFHASGPVCLALGASTGIGGVICVAAVVAGGAWLGSTGGGKVGEWGGEFLYEKTQP
jgi:hypothetical protein